MTASDHLGVQFWPIEKVGALRSGNHRGMTLEQEHAARSAPGEVRDYENRRAQHHGFADADEHLGALKTHIAASGIANPPTYRDDGDGDMMTSGAHRYMAARELGWKTLPVKPWDGSGTKPVEGWRGNQ